MKLSVYIKINKGSLSYFEENSLILTEIANPQVLLKMNLLSHGIVWW